MDIREFTMADEDNLFAMLREEGSEWEEYWGNPEKYRKALYHSVTFVAYDGDMLSGQEAV